MDSDWLSLLLFFVPSISVPVVVPPLASAPPLYSPPVLSSFVVVVLTLSHPSFAGWLLLCCCR